MALRRLEKIRSGAGQELGMAGKLHGSQSLPPAEELESIRRMPADKLEQAAKDLRGLLVRNTILRRALKEKKEFYEKIALGIRSELKADDKRSASMATVGETLRDINNFLSSSVPDETEEVLEDAYDEVDRPASKVGDGSRLSDMQKRVTNEMITLDRENTNFERLLRSFPDRDKDFLEDLARNTPKTKNN